MKRYICAMGVSRQTAETQLVSISGELTEHLIKLYLFPDSEFYDHWRQEVASFLRKSPRLKGTNKPPKAEFIYECISCYMDEIEDLVRVILDDYSSYSAKRTDVGKATNLLDDYFTWISSKLSKDVAISNAEIYAKLDELGL